MNRKNSRELLAELQRRAGYVSREEQEAVLGSIKFPSEFGNAMEVYNQGIKGVEEKLPAKYQDPGEYVLLEHIFEDIRSFVKNLKTDDKRIKELESRQKEIEIKITKEKSKKTFKLSRRNITTYFAEIFLSFFYEFYNRLDILKRMRMMIAIGFGNDRYR